MTTTLVTGANKSLGLETTRRLIAAGHTVYAGMRDLATGEAARDAAVPGPPPGDQAEPGPGRGDTRSVVRTAAPAPPIVSTKEDRA